MIKKTMKLMAVFMVQLIIFLPLVSSLEISNVAAKDSTDKFALITWDTDEPADSRVFYGEDKENLALTKTDIDKTRNHSMFIGDLQPSKVYYYKVKSVNGGTAEDDNGGQMHAFQTQQTDNLPSYIEVVIPEYSNKARIDINGKTEPLTRVDLYVNDVKIRKSDPNEKGEFNFPSVELSVFRTNEIRINAVDSAGNTAEKIFSSTVDLIQPEVTIPGLPSITTEPSLEISGTISELAFLEISLNEEVMFGESLSNFSETLSLEEGANSIKIRAIDRAGNTASLTRSVILDTTPPIIENLKPEAGAFFYEGGTETNIDGDTEPNAKVELYVDKEPDGRPHLKTDADPNGHFEFDDVDLEGPFLEHIGGLEGDIEIGYAPVPSEETTEEAESLREQERRGEGKQEERTVKLYFVVRDAAGHVTQEQISYTIGTCFAGGMNWGVNNLIEYQSPNLLSPERLGEGTELISAILNLSYRGFGENPQIKSIRFEKACDATEMATDERYNMSCKIIPNSPTLLKGNDKKTLWYLKYNLNKLEGLDDFTEDLKEDLSRQFWFPLKIKIEYTHKLYGGNETTEFQTSCIRLAYVVDTSRVDPRDVLPDWLLEDGTEFLNETITDLNNLIKQLDTVVKYAAIACLVGFAAKTLTIMYRNWQSWWDYLQDKTISVKDDKDKTKCPKPGKTTKKRIGAGGAITDDTTQADLSTEALENRCPAAAAAWKTEASAYNLYRWACDRFLCSGTPAKWTEKATPVEVRQRIEKGRLCAGEVGTDRKFLRPDQECSDKQKKPCWEYSGKLYVFSGKTTTKEDGGTYYELQEVPGPGRLPSLRTLEAERDNQGRPMLILKKDCAEECEKRGYLGDKKAKPPRAPGECISKISEVLDYEHAFEQSAICPNKDQTCYCIGRKLTKEERAEVTAVGEEEKEKWDYRYDKLGYITYDKYKYYEGRDKSACFGQDNFIFRDSPYLNPQEMIPAFQCLCVSQIKNRLVLLRNMMQGLYNCLMQIKTTGTADAGICKEIFTQYVCKWLYRLVSYFMQGCMPWSGTGKDNEVGIEDYIQAGSSSIFGGVFESTSDLQSDYDSAAMDNFLGVGEETVANKICLGAMTGDWGWDLEGFMDTAYATPFYTSARAFPADREYLTWNPTNDLSTYEYQVAWMIAPGCELDSYTVSLACVTDNEFFTFDGVSCEGLRENQNSPSGGCDCIGVSQSTAVNKVSQDRPGPAKIIYTSRRVSQGIFQDGSRHVTAEEARRYDHVKITAYVNNDEDFQKCIPEANRVGNRIGVFYSPITDATTHDIAACRWDLISGQFLCRGGGLLWDQRGRAYFGDIKCGDQDCKDKEFYAGDRISISDLQAYAQGKDQCLQVTLKNGYGSTVYNRDFLVKANPDDSSQFTKISPSPFKVDMIEKLDDPHFTRSVPRYTITPTGLVLSRIEEQGEITAIPGNYPIWIRHVQTPSIGKFNGDFSLDGTTWIPFTKDTEFPPIGGIKFQIKQKPLGVSETGQKQFTIKITPVSTVVTQAPWHLFLELRHYPEEGQSCTDSRSEDMISYQGIFQKRDITLSILPKTQQDYNRCDPGGTVFNRNAQCDCNRDGTKTGAEDCDGDTKVYCYQNNLEQQPSCKEIPACVTGDRLNSAACDCDLYGTIDEYEKTCKYCIDNIYCSDTKPEVAIAAQPSLPTADTLIKTLTQEELKKLRNAESTAPSDALWILIEHGGDIVYLKIIDNLLYGQKIGDIWRRTSYSEDPTQRVIYRKVNGGLQVYSMKYDVWQQTHIITR
ncbi:hypothetical protein GOV06_02450 [Candidatus Woesearchaeota archaeon]|nr:hypothetical protein [Candidatus Woesearchaeota archaeon]